MYKNISELPDAVKVLPEHAQEIFMAAFNSAFEQYKGDASGPEGTPARREEKCFAVAWAAVKNKYEKKDDEWVEISKNRMHPALILKEIASDAPGEFQLLPQGKIDIEGEGPALIDEESARLILQYQDRRGNDMVIDYEHQSLGDREAPAAGWIKKMVNKGTDGIWVVVEWTKRASEYIANREYRFFSPVILVRPSDKRIVAVMNVALTNFPKINNLRPIISKLEALRAGVLYEPEADRLLDIDPDREDRQQKGKEEKLMLEKLKKLLGLAADAAEAKVEEAVQLLVNKVKSSETTVACKEVLEAVGAKAEATKDEVIQIVASLKAPADVAKTLSLEVADLRKQLQEIKQTDLVQLALKEGKTSPEELDKWGRDLALRSPEQFKVIVLSRPAGSVIPIGGILPAPPARDGGMDEVQKSINKMMGISDETWKKYNVKA
jgi:phage I-like protein/cation transport regulator ChaB